MKFFLAASLCICVRVRLDVLVLYLCRSIFLVPCVFCGKLVEDDELVAAAVWKGCRMVGLF